MEIKEYTSIIAIVFSSVSLLLSFITFIKSRKDKKEEHRKEIFDLIIEANSKCRVTKSSVKRLEELMSQHLPNENVDFTAENQLIDKLYLGINDVIFKLKDKNESHDGLYFLSKELVNSIDTTYQSVTDRIDKYQTT